jgi:hypothetical protein
MLICFRELSSVDDGSLCACSYVTWNLLMGNSEASWVLYVHLHGHNEINGYP